MPPSWKTWAVPGGVFRLGDDASHARRAIACYRRALAVYGRPRYPEKFAALENNLGNAYLSLPDENQGATMRHARRALRHFERALAVTRRDPHSRAFGVTQYNRAQAYLRLARHAPEANLGLAAACLENSQERLRGLRRRPLRAPHPRSVGAPARPGHATVTLIVAIPSHPVMRPADRDVLVIVLHHRTEVFQFLRIVVDEHQSGAHFHRFLSGSTAAQPII